MPSALPVRPSPTPPRGLALLLQALDYALELQHSPWDFAVEIELLRQAGLTHNDLRWLLCQGQVEHALERPAAQGEPRSFLKAGDLELSERSCFVLTAAGAAAARATVDGSRSADADGTGNGNGNGEPQQLPRWDADLRELWVGGKLLKRFPRRAPNQELILAAFQEQGWPPRIDDPLPPRGERHAHCCLHDTVIRLNRTLRRRGLRFHGDGSGSGVRWEWARATRTRCAPHRHLTGARSRRNCRDCQRVAMQ
jgi:hypothetical protein